MLRYLLAIALTVAGGYAFGQNAPSANPPIGVAGAYNSAAPTCTSGQACWLQTDVNGNLKTTLGGASGGATTTVTNSTISVTNTFQAALAGSVSRKGCLLQNQGSHVMYAFFGTIGSATTANSLQVQAGQTVSCNTGLIVLTDAVNLTGTAGDAYVVNSQ